MKKYLFTIILILLCIPCYAYAEECTIVSGNGKDLGSEITCDEEHFYVLSNDDTTVKLLSKYNLYTGVAIYKVKIEKESGDTRTDAQYCSDLAAANDGTVKNDGFYTATVYCFYAKTINVPVMRQDSTALSANGDSEGNYLYQQVQ